MNNADFSCTIVNFESKKEEIAKPVVRQKLCSQYIRASIRLNTEEQFELEMKKCLEKTDKIVDDSKQRVDQINIE